MAFSTLHGDETGLLKHIVYDDDDGNSKVGKVTAVFGKQCRENGIDRMLYLDEERLLLATANGSVSLWNGDDISPTAIDGFSGSRIRALLKSSEERLVVCGDKVSWPPCVPSCVLLTCVVLWQGKVEVIRWPEVQSLGQFQVNGAVENGAIHGSSLAVGGKDHNLRIWNLETNELVFRPKNVPHDEISMPVPIWMTDVKWTSDEHVLFASTAFNQIRVFDTREAKPVKTVELAAQAKQADRLNHHINCMEILPSGGDWDADCAVVGDTLGSISLVDVLNMGRSLGVFKGPNASVRSLCINAAEGVLASGGLDRYIHLFDLATRKKIARCYVKQKVTAICFDQTTHSEQEEEEDEFHWDDDEEEEEEEEEDRQPSVRPEKRTRRQG